jgi:hypothetical protein
MALTKVSRGLLSTSIVDNGNATAITIDSSENVGIGTGSPSSFNHLSTSPHLVVGGGSSDAGVTYYSSTNGYGRLAFADGTNTTEQYRGLIQYYHGDNSMQFYTGSDERMRIEAAGQVVLTASTPSIKMIDSDDNSAQYIQGYGGGLGYYADDNNAISNSFHRFFIDGTEKLRIDSSGNLLVGTTDTDPSNNGAGGDAGHAFSSTGYISSARSGGSVALFNRMDSDGDIAAFRKDGTVVGSIGAAGGDLYIDGAGGQVKFYISGSIEYEMDDLQFFATTDNANDLGAASRRWDDVYATNGTIQTSDRNEKQDIAELSDAEQRVAVAAKGLLRKFRWKDSVAEKGDEARTHFGIIAQDLQAAFTAEGLDAGDYAMFISSTWTDEETNEEKTRMGVRYSELLAFIIAAI